MNFNLNFQWIVNNNQVPISINYLLTFEHNKRIWNGNDIVAECFFLVMHVNTCLIAYVLLRSLCSFQNTRVKHSWFRIFGRVLVTNKYNKDSENRTSLINTRIRTILLNILKYFIYFFIVCNWKENIISFIVFKYIFLLWE